MDRFIYSSGEKLASIFSQEYRLENEKDFLRFRRLPAGGWEAHRPNGTRLLFGETSAAHVQNSYGVFRWHLEHEVDTHGNEIRYLYSSNGGYVYLLEIRYNFTSGGRYNAVVFQYGPRPDIFTDRVSRSEVSLAWRCKAVEVWAVGRLVRMYRFTYAAPDPLVTRSLLRTITEVGEDGISELPPTTFTYTAFDPHQYAVISMQDPPPIGLLNGDAELVDINFDGLPDVVYTPLEGQRYYINHGNGAWQASPVYPQQSPADRMSSPAVHIADMDGNQVADLLVKSGTGSGAPFYYYAGQPGSLLGACCPGRLLPQSRLRPGRSECAPCRPEQR